jgi:uncharacterized protein YndB with AHSA1/START domain
MEFDHQLTIARPAPEVFARLCDWSGHPEWIEGLTASAALDPTPGVGQRFRQRLERGPLHIDLEGRVTEYAPPRRLAFEATARDAHLGIALDLVEVGAGTQLTQRSTVRLESFVLRLMAGKIRAELEQKQRADLERLRALLEG